jgi:hypothetical protein
MTTSRKNTPASIQVSKPFRVQASSTLKKFLLECRHSSEERYMKSLFTFVIRPGLEIQEDAKSTSQIKSEPSTLLQAAIVSDCSLSFL